VREGAVVEVRYGRERCIKIERSAAYTEFLPRGKTRVLIILEAAEKWRRIILERWNGFGSGKQCSRLRDIILAPHDYGYSCRKNNFSTD